ncbi:MAG: Holliday junction resolvase RuvX [Pirellulales bacterium]
MNESAGDEAMTGAPSEPRSEFPGELPQPPARERSWPLQGRIAAIDFGTVRIGVAVTDPDRRFASPWETYARRSVALDADFFVRLTRDERIVAYVVGLPVYPSGDESPKSREARRFGLWLAGIVDRPVVFYDERYSSVVADEYMAQAGLTAKRRKERRDQLAAQILLQAFLDAGQNATHRASPLDNV